MQNSKQLAVMFLLGAFVVGGALGFTADRVWGRDAACRDPRGSRELLYDRLELTGVGAGPRCLVHKQDDVHGEPAYPRRTL